MSELDNIKNIVKTASTLNNVKDTVDNAKDKLSDTYNQLKDKVSNKTNDSNSSSSSSGSATKMSYSSLYNVCENIVKILNDVKTQFATVEEMFRDKNNIWRGKAGDKYWTTLYNGRQVNFEEISDIANSILPDLIKTVEQIIENNKNLDYKIINNNTPITAQAKDNVHANNAVPAAQGVDTALNDAVKVDDRIKAKDTTTDAKGVDTTLNNAVQADDRIKAKDVTTDAKGVNTSTIDAVKVNNDIRSKNADPNAQGANTETGSENN